MGYLAQPRYGGGGLWGGLAPPLSDVPELVDSPWEALPSQE